MPKYIDHGCYSSAVIVGSMTSGGVLTVTSITSGRVTLGANVIISGQNIGCRITTLASGTMGLAGSTYNTKNYTASAFSGTFTLLQGCPDNTIGSTFWGIPQEGDGEAKAPSTASATISIDLSAYTAAAGNTISIGGAILTCVASGATNNQFNAGTGTTLIDNIVTAINRAGNTVTVAAAAANWATPKVQDCVFARRTGNNLEIMTRAGSAVYNNNASWKVLTTGFTGGSQIDAMLSGGVSGAWGYLTGLASRGIAYDGGTYWPSGMDNSSYGHWNYSSTVIAGSRVAGDLVHVRSGKTIRTHRSQNSVFYFTSYSGGTSSNPMTYVVDDGTEWPEDGSEPQTTFTFVEGHSQAYQFNGHGTAGLRIIAKRYSDTKYGLVFDAFGINYLASINPGRMAYLEGVDFKSVSGTIMTIQHGTYATSAQDNYSCTVFNRSRFYSRANGNMLQTQPGTYSGGAVLLRDCIFEMDPAITTQQTLIFTNPGGGAGFGEILLEGCRFVNFVDNSTLFPATYNAQNVKIQFVDCDLGGIKVVRQARAATSSGYTQLASEYECVTSYSTRAGQRDFFIDNLNGFMGWMSWRSPPTCYAKQLDGVTGWVLEVVPASAANILALSNPFKTMRFNRINTLANGARTFKVQIAPEQTLSLTSDTVALHVCYTDINDKQVFVSSYTPLASNAIAASSATWSNESGGQVNFVANGTLHNKNELSVATTTNLKQDTEITAWIEFYGRVTDVSKVILVDPEVIIQ